MMIRRSVHANHSRRVLLVSAHDTMTRFLSSEETKDAFGLNSVARPGSESSILPKADNDDKLSNGGNRFSKDTNTEFVPFFKQVDNFDRNTTISAFFESLGDSPPPARPKSNMPPPTAAAPKVMTSPLEGKSIFDAFPIPETPLGDYSDVYEEESYRQYRDIIDEVISDNRFRRMHTKRPFTDEFLEPIKLWLQAAEPQVEYKLPILQKCVEQGYTFKRGNVEAKDAAESFRKELDIQREVFLEKVPLTAEQYEQVIVALVLLGNICAKRGRSLPLDVAWEKIKEAGICLSTGGLNSYLYSCSLYVNRQKNGLLTSLAGDSILDRIGSALGSAQESAQDDDENRDEEYLVNLPEEVATFHDLLYEPTEQSLTIRIKSLVAKGNASGAEALLDSFAVCPALFG